MISWVPQDKTVSNQRGPSDERGGDKALWNISVHRSFIRSDFVTMPVTSPFAVTRTAL